MDRCRRLLILGALAAKGGQKYLEKQADDNPTAFLTLVGKILPLNVNATVKRDIREYTENELRAILAEGGGRGAAEADNKEEPRQLH